MLRTGGGVFEEIKDQPRLWKSTLDGLAARRQELQGWLRSENFGQVLFLGSGASYGAALSAASITQLVSGLNTVAISSSEILFLRRPPYDSRIKTLVVALSRKGDERDNLWAVQKLKKIHTTCKVLMISGAAGELGALSDQKILLDDAVEMGQISTRCASTLLLCCMVLCAWLSAKDVFLNEIARLPGALNYQNLQDQIKRLSMPRPLPQHITFLGSGPYVGAACDGSLKMREMAAIGSEYQSTLEYRHGSHGWLTNQSMVVVLLSDTFKPAELQTVSHLGVTRAPRVLIADNLDDQARMRVDFTVELQAGVSEVSRVLLMYPALQLLGFYMALAKGKSADKPKHLEHVIELKDRPGV
ncbi:MAG: SIS domain-containing protein [Armatimonadetes bacterium]|nr:SIS domain-containing protein [Armatimonadota bacterium]